MPAQPEFKANLTSLYMTPNSKVSQNPNDHTLHHYVSHASGQLCQLSFWQSKRLKFLYLQLNFLKPTQTAISTNPKNIIPQTVEKTVHQTRETFLEHKRPQKFIFQT